MPGIYLESNPIWKAIESEVNEFLRSVGKSDWDFMVPDFNDPEHDDHQFYIRKKISASEAIEIMCDLIPSSSTEWKICYGWCCIRGNGSHTRLEDVDGWRAEEIVGYPFMECFAERMRARGVDVTIDKTIFRMDDAYYPENDDDFEGDYPAPVPGHPYLRLVK